MKTFFFSLLLISSISCKSQTSISPDSTKNYIGKTETVCGKIIDSYTSKDGNTFLNFGAKYPNQTFTIFIPAKYAVDTITPFKNKNVCVRGTIKLYRENLRLKFHPEIRLK